MSDGMPEGYEEFAASALKEQQQGPEAAVTPAKMTASPPGYEDFAASALKEQQYDTPEQQIKAGVEGAAQGFLSKPVTTGIETNILGVKPEDIAGREEANPWTHGLAETAGLGAGFLTGTGEAGLVMKAGESIAGAAKLGKIGSAALKGAIETGLLQGSDEVGNAMLGKGDPEAPVASALAHMGAAGALGLVTGGALATTPATNALQALADTRVGTKISKFMEDFGNRWKYNTTNPDLTDAIAQELTDFHSGIKSAHDEVYGSTGLKAQAIEKLVPEMNDAIQTQNQELATSVQNKFAKMIQDQETYPIRLTKKLQSDVQPWMEVITNPGATSNDVFAATQDLKQRLQAYSKFDRQIGPLSPEKDFINTAKELAHKFRTSLEDSGVWGKAGKLQQGVNQAFTDFLPTLKDFERNFTTKVLEEPTIDPRKIQTYTNQIGKSTAEIKQSMMKNFIKASEEYQSEIGKLHDALGVPSSVPLNSLGAVKGTLGQETHGGKFADFLFKRGIPDIASTSAAGTGGAIGYGVGGELGAGAGYLLAQHLGRVFENTIGYKMTGAMRNTVVPAFLRMLSTGESAGALKAMDYATAVARGTKSIDSGVEALFKSGGSTAIDSKSDIANREKLKKYIAEGKFIEQGQAQASPLPHKPQSKGFAEGGVIAAPRSNASEQAPNTLTQGMHGVSTHFPEQAVMLSSAKGRISTYLNSLKPQPPMGRLPFDNQKTDKEVNRRYERAIDIANKPLSVLDHIKNGTITPDHVKHLGAMYPELHNQISKKLSEHIVKMQMEDMKPSYKVRQGISLFTGSPLDSTFTPAFILAAQPMPAQNQQQTATQPASSPKRSTASLNKIPKMYQTQAQSAERDRINRE